MRSTVELDLFRCRSPGVRRAFEGLNFGIELLLDADVLVLVDLSVVGSGHHITRHPALRCGTGRVAIV